MKNKALIALILALVLCLSSLPALACTAIYVGSDLTVDGTTLFARSEDISNSMNKLYFTSPAGKYKAGENYQGCYGFTYVFSHDSYSFNCFSDDNGTGVSGVCPDCGGTHPHNPYGAAGTNEKGVTVTATETLSGGSKLIKAVDPFNKVTGIEEAEIPTVLLSEAATAKEAVDLLLSIYDNVGAQAGSGIFIADDTETWYIENVSGTQYIALKLNGGLAFAVPNQSAIGLIDLDDENVIASAKLIAVAKEAGTYVGDEAANTIDFIGSYLPDQKAGDRYFLALNYFNGNTAKNTKEEILPTDYAISNVDSEGNIVPLYTNITLDRAYGVSDVIGYYDIKGIGSTSNLEIHIFQIAKDNSLTDTVEWVAMDNGCYNVFVPYYPMLTQDTYAAYQLSTPKASFTEEQPTEGIYYATTYRKQPGYKVLPTNWADSYYWTFDALSNLCEYGNVDTLQVQAVENQLAKLQVECYQMMDAMEDAVKAASTPEEAAKIATQMSMDAAKHVHTKVVALVNAIQ